MRPPVMLEILKFTYCLSFLFFCNEKMMKGFSTCENENYKKHFWLLFHWYSKKFPDLNEKSTFMIRQTFEANFSKIFFILNCSS